MTGNTDLEVKFTPKQREMLQKFRVSLKISWEPGSLPGSRIISHPALNLEWFKTVNQSKPTIKQYQVSLFVPVFMNSYLTQFDLFADTGFDHLFTC